MILQFYLIGIFWKEWNYETLLTDTGTQSN